MLEAFLKTLVFLSEYKNLKVIFGCVLGSILVIFVLYLVFSTVLISIPFTEITIIDFLIKILLGLGGLVTTWFIFPIFITFFISLFVDKIIDTTIKEYYPHFSNISQSNWKVFIESIKFLLLTLLINLILLPFYLLFIFFPPLGFLFFYLINGYLLSKEYYNLVAMRFLTFEESAIFWKKNRFYLIGDGILMSFSFYIPILNLITPVLLAIYMLHRFINLGRSIIK
ncbi:MAG: EI24 domain-containing protein [Alphaproteobacteria bacterium]|nr:EI24 domain-containing protein [Alphaproteobacteria bacterium]